MVEEGGPPQAQVPSQELSKASNADPAGKGFFLGELRYPTAFTGWSWQSATKINLKGWS